MRLARLEVWSALACASGQRLAILPAVERATRRDVLQGACTLTVLVPTATATAASARRVLRTVWPDGSYEEWILTRNTRRHDERGNWRELVAADPSILLGTAPPVTRTEADGTVVPEFELLGLTASQHLLAVGGPLTAAGFGFITQGVIETTARVDITYSWSSPLEIVKRLAAATGTEWRLRRDGTIGYRIDLLTRIGSATPVLDARLGRNLRGVVVEEGTTELATRVFPRGVDKGDGIRATMARNRWTVASVGGTTLLLVDPAGGDGPVLVEDQVTGLYLRVPGGTPTLILDSSAPGTVVVASATGLTVGTTVEICASSTGGDVVSLADPTAVAAYGFVAGVADRPDLTDTVNLLPNPFTRA